ncbi:L-gulonolactone oxidase [Lentzea sp. NBRC 105346]|uniref:D-arabinono-1,4-lactone oxidase n=1 Tax=Lentzea sp. NBRC 105346 TaxID=3032205 RepID=UPI0024A22C49|nr:D-arabinono-1,4-lactone oxidase [Lentzea sp. NBRC 105346]GLZ32653.1 L-gulonolactone oxidase [Lentzea sp. NBRC 105346]
MWTNWARTATANPVRVVHPASTDEIAAAVTSAGRVRARGSGHSFNDIAVAPEVAMDLDRWTGIVRADVETGLVTVRSGTPLHALNADLHRLGLAMPNLGDIDAQTIAGAVSTSTHGTGAKLGVLATFIESLELVLADGSLVTCSASERPDLFNAARVGLGALGVISTLTLRCVPSFVLRASEGPGRLDAVLEEFDDLCSVEDHVEFHWFTHSDRVILKRNNRIDEPARPLSKFRQFYEYELFENAAFGAVCKVAKTFPRSTVKLNEICGALVSDRSYSDYSHNVFVTPRRVRFVETEFAIPRSSLLDVIAELRNAAARVRDALIVPCEVRVAQADDIWLSTAQGRDTAYISMHQALGMGYHEFFDIYAQIAKSVGGRPHWGKMHNLSAEDLRPLYPHFDDFLRVRDEVDPNRIFSNAYLDRVLG